MENVRKNVRKNVLLPRHTLAVNCCITKRTISPKMDASSFEKLAVPRFRTALTKNVRGHSSEAVQDVISRLLTACVILHTRDSVSGRFRANTASARFGIRMWKSQTDADPTCLEVEVMRESGCRNLTAAFFDVLAAVLDAKELPASLSDEAASFSHKAALASAAASFDMF